MRHIQINSDLYLIEQPLPTRPALAKPEPTNHIWIIDRSGSMTWLLPRLIDDLKGQVENIPAGDTLSLGWFSSEGTFGFPIKGFKISEPSDYDKLRSMLNQYRNSVALTCFSEILEEADANVVKDLAFYSNRFALYLFTDGYPVVSNTALEEKRIEAVLKRLSGKLISSMFVGYGDYYNKPLMAKMGEWAGGTLIHCSELAYHEQDMSEFIGRSSHSMPRQSVTPLGTPTLMFTADPVCPATRDDDGSAFIPARATSFFYLNPSPIGTKVEPSALQADDSILAGAYAAATILSQRLQTDAAIDVLAAIGDAKFIDALTNAFTTQEYGAAEVLIAEATVDPLARFMNGQKFNYVPDPNAFCILDLLDLVMEDTEAKFYPRNPAFRYKRTGRPSQQKEGYPSFIASDEGVPLASLTWNASRLNLSVLARIPGHIELPEDATKVGLPVSFHTHIWRNYIVIKDGVLWTVLLPVSTSQDTWVILQEKGVIDIQSEWEEGKVVILDLSSLPLINRAIAQDLLKQHSAQDIAKLALEDAKMGAELKVYKDLLKQLRPDDTGLSDAFTPAQQEYLTKVGVTKNGFAPPTEEGDATDFYMAPSFQIKVSGFSSLPKVADVQTKMEAKKKLNAPGQAMAEALTLYTQAMKSITDEELKVKWLENSIKTIKNIQSDSRKVVQRVKAAVVLGKQWFPEFDSRDNCTIDLDAATVTFELGSTKVTY